MMREVYVAVLECDCGNGCPPAVGLTVPVDPAGFIVETFDVIPAPSAN